MVCRTRVSHWVIGVVLLGLIATPAMAQIEDQLSAYTGDNAIGYLQPLADAFGAGLNDGFYRSAYIPREGVHISLEFRAMGVLFGDEAKTFEATTESGFQPVTTVDAPTVIGDGSVVLVDGDAGTHFAFPGGFSIGSFGLAVPQLRISAVKGTEAVFRYIAVSTGNSELGEVSLFGIGARHSLSQYKDEDFPLDIALGFLWQTFSMGENEAGDKLLSASALTAGLQVSRRYTKGALTFEPFAGLSMDSFAMNAAYQSDDEEPVSIDLAFDRSNTVDFTIGAAFNLQIINFHGEYSFAGQNSFSFGVAIGNLMYQ